MEKIAFLANMLKLPINIFIIVFIFLAYHIIVMFISTLELNISLIDRLDIYLYILTSDILKFITLTIAPFLIALYFILSLCSNQKASLSLPLTTVITSGISCLGCSLPILAGIGTLASFITMLLPLSIIIMSYLIYEKLVYIELRKIKCNQ